MNKNYYFVVFILPFLVQICSGYCLIPVAKFTSDAEREVGQLSFHETQNMQRIGTEVVKRLFVL